MGLVVMSSNSASADTVWKLAADTFSLSRTLFRSLAGTAFAEAPGTNASAKAAVNMILIFKCIDFL